LLHALAYNAKIIMQLIDKTDGGVVRSMVFQAQQQRGANQPAVTV
jgi:hypothetical protein